MVIGLLLYEDDMMHMVHAYLLLYLQVVHFIVLFWSSVCNDVCKVLRVLLS